MTSAADALQRQPTRFNDRNTASFRDRDGYVFSRDGRIFRALTKEGGADWLALRTSKAYSDLVGRGLLIDSREAGSGAEFNLGPQCELVLEHPRIQVISYPYEWTFAMLKDAALLQLQVLHRLVEDGLVLKDGTPYNVQWRRGRPTFIDIGSIAPLRRTRLWEGYRQFCRLQLYPLLLQAALGVDFRPFLRGRMDGPTAAETAALLGWRSFHRRGVLTHVHLHAKVENRGGMEPMKFAANPEISAGLVAHNVAGLQRAIEGLRWVPHRSTWSEYGERAHYSQSALKAKESFVGECLAARSWQLVWDIGCNDGKFSRLAAEHADAVLALDSDPLTIDRLYAQLTQERRENIVSLCIDLADASPRQGWRGQERRSLEERAQPDLVLGLAVLHHLVIGANLPLDDVMDWLRQLGAAVLIEWVDRSDPMVERMLSQRRDVFGDYTREAFEATLARHFRVERRLTLEGETRSVVLALPGESGR